MVRRFSREPVVARSLKHSVRDGAAYSVMPGLLTIGDIADVAGLIAPKPLCIEMGIQDRTFVIGDARKAYRHLSRIYKAAGAADHLVKDEFDGAHEFSGAKCLAWFDQWLKKA